ncbi:hypothetical protein Tco_1376532 [Tanacetum coccineum]
MRVPNVPIARLSLYAFTILVRGKQHRIWIRKIEPLDLIKLGRFVSKFINQFSLLLDDESSHEIKQFSAEVRQKHELRQFLPREHIASAPATPVCTLSIDHTGSQAAMQLITPNDMACEESLSRSSGFTDIIACGNSTLRIMIHYDPDCQPYNPFYYDPEGDILLLEAILI